MPVDPRTLRARAAIRRARLYTWSNRLVRWLPNVFVTAVLLFVTAMWIAAAKSEFYGTILAIPTAAIVLLTGVAYPWSLALRDWVDRGQPPLRFRLSHLFWLTTEASIVIGLLVYFLRHT